MSEIDTLGAMDVGNGWPFSSSNGAWDKDSDINVQVYGSVPEPWTLVLIAISMLTLPGMGWLRQRAGA